MRISGHSYNNEVFDSLLNGISQDVVIKKASQQPQEDVVSGSDIFSFASVDQMSDALKSELIDITSELQYAADNAKISLSDVEVLDFCKTARSEKLRGKKLQRAAQKFCNNLNRQVASPEGATRINLDTLSTASSNTVLPAGYPEGHGVNDRMTGSYMGCSKNPNSIWDTDAMDRFASKYQDADNLFGDEKIKISKTKKEEYRQAMKDQPWMDMQDALSAQGLIKQNSHSISSLSSSEDSTTGGVLPKNAMSIFNEDRDFANIPENTLGETIKEINMQRKAARENKEPQDIKPATKIDNSLSSMFEMRPDNGQTSQQNNQQRSAVDRLFEGIMKNTIKE